MLKLLRHKKTAKKIWIALAIVVVPAFVLWGLGGALRSQKESAYIGKISGKNISYLEYKDSFDAVKNQAVLRFGDNLAEMQKYLNLEAQAWERLVLLGEAKKLKVKVSDQEVVNFIQSEPIFQGRAGFDNRIYSETLRYALRTQPRVFEEQTRQNLALSKLYKEVTKDVALSDSQIKEEYYKANEEISLDYISSSSSDFIKGVSVTSDEARDYYMKNTLQFKQPLSFNIEYVAIGTDDASLTATDKIKNLSLRLNKIKDFAKAAGELGLSVKETGLFGETDPIPGIGWSPEILKIISRLKTGEFSKPILIDKYYYILMLKERKEPHTPDFEKIKNRVEEALKKDKARSLANAKIVDCLGKLNERSGTSPKSVDFAAAAAESGLISGSTGLFKYGSYIEGIGASDNFWLAAKGLKEGGFSDIIEMPGGFYIIKLKNRTPVDEKKFAAEKTDFALRLLLQRKQEYFNKFTEELKKITRSNFKFSSP